jgi:hypothetical protein
MKCKLKLYVLACNGLFLNTGIRNTVLYRVRFHTFLLFLYIIDFFR